MFGEGSITEEAADYIRANPGINTEIEQFNVLGYMAGDLFEMPEVWCHRFSGLNIEKIVKK